MRPQPNPLDPLDDLKRWFRDLWPIEQLGVICAAITVITVLLLWVTR